MSITIDTLTAPERALVRAVANAFFPPDGPIPISGIVAGIPEYFEGYVRRSSARQTVLIRLLLAFTELSPLMFGPRRARFTQLSHDERVRFLESVRTSRIYFRRVSFVSFRAMMTMAYLANDDVARHVGMTADADPYGLGRSGGEDEDEYWGEDEERVRVSIEHEHSAIGSARSMGEHEERVRHSIEHEYEHEHEHELEPEVA